MLRGLVVILVALTSCASRPPAAEAPSSGGAAVALHALGRLEDRYDPARDATVVRVIPAADPAAPRLVAGTTYPGRTLTSPPESALVGFRRGGNAWRYEGCTTIELLADGAKLIEAPALRDTELRGSELVELLTTVVPLATIARFAWAGRAELKACGDTVSFPREDRELLSRFVKRLTPP
jgi:hypothetical protein